jgi:hypothetical protein
VSDPVAEFVHMFKPQPWVADAACRGLTTLFYSISTVDIAQAKKVCAGCPVIDECRQAAQERPTRFGVWGGQSVKQQRAERPRSGSTMSAPSSTIEEVPAEPMTNAELRRIVKKIGLLHAERERLILKAHQEGASLREIAEILEVNHVTVRNALQKLSWRIANEKPPDDLLLHRRGRTLARTKSKPPGADNAIRGAS